MHEKGEGEAVASIGETLASGNARLIASRRILDDLDRRLSRASRLLDDGDGDETPATD